MIERWILFYDGACPLCTKAQSWTKYVKGVKMTTVDLNSEIAKQKGYNKDLVLETSTCVYSGAIVIEKILSRTILSGMGSALKPVSVAIYFLSNGLKRRRDG